MSVRALATVLLALLSGCAAGRAGIVSLSVEAIPTGQQEWRKIGRGHIWHSGDRYVLRVESDRAAYVHVVRLPPKGPLQVLYPREGQPAQVLQPGSVLQLPVGDPWFILDDNVGEDSLRVIAALRPLSGAQIEKEARRPSATKVRDPPPIRTTKDRTAAIARAWIDVQGQEGGGVGVVCFSFQHE